MTKIFFSIFLFSLSFSCIISASSSNEKPKFEENFGEVSCGFGFKEFNSTLNSINSNFFDFNELEKAIFEANYAKVISILQSQNCLVQVLNFGHVEGLLVQNGENSTEILKFIFNLNQDFENEIQCNLFKYLNLAASKSYDKFEFLWDRFSGEFLNETSLAELLEVVALNWAVPVYKFIKKKIFLQNEFETIRFMALENASDFSKRVKLENFFAEMDKMSIE